MTDRRSTLPPQALLSLVTGLGLVAAALATLLAASAPVPSARLSVVDDEVRVALPGERGLAHVVAFVDASGARIDADPRLLLAEPDVLPTFGDIERFLEGQGFLARALAGGGVTLELSGGERRLVAAAPRGVAHLPFEFWMQIAFALVGLVLGGAVWAFKAGALTTRLYALTGACFALSAMTAAVYSTRELALDPALFRSLSAVNAFGTVIFAGALLGLLFNYPAPLRPWPVASAAIVTALALWALSLAQLGDKQWVGPQAAVFLLFLPCFPVAWLQWRRHSKDPVSRATLQWFFLSIFSGTVLFAALVLAPPLFGIAPFAEQSSMFGVFLLMYAGIAAALTRYRLFDIERWWFNALLWFLGGASIVLLDALLLMTLPMAGVTATFAAVAVVGWLYFPARQWLWGRLFPHRRRRFGELLQGFAAKIAGVRNLEAFELQFRDTLEEAFRPLSIARARGGGREVVIGDDGLSLTLPETAHLSPLRLEHAGRGTRLFSRDDAELARALRSLAAQGAEALAEKERVIEDERQRIMRDLHDDLGGKLLAITHTSAERGRELARSALQDVGDVLAALEAGPTTLEELAEECRWELQSRAEAHGFEASLVAPGVDGVALSAREATNLARIVREAVTNAIRHAGARNIEVRFELSPPRLRVTVRSDGEVGDPAAWKVGRGRKTMRLRARDLGGEVSWSLNDEGSCVVRAEVALASTDEPTVRSA